MKFLWYKNISLSISKATFSTASNGYPNKLEPVVVYLDIEQNKYQIVRENKNKSGIYRWTNSISGKSYIGSSIDLGRRFSTYLSTHFLRTCKRGSIVYKALLKYGYSNFKFEILEYCDTTIILEREQYYIDTYLPEYNILTIAGAPSGYKHTKEAIEKMIARHLNRKNSEESKRKMSQAKGLKGIVTVTNLESGEIVEYCSLREAAQKLGTHHETLRRCIKSEKVFLEKYIITIISA